MLKVLIWMKKELKIWFLFEIVCLFINIILIMIKLLVRLKLVNLGENGFKMINFVCYVEFI